MVLVFVYGPPAAGKYTIGSTVAALTGLPLFHNHLVVDTVATLFAFGTKQFVSLRHEFWIRSLSEAAAAGRSLIFTFLPEPSVSPEFVPEVVETVRAAGGRVIFVHLQASRKAQLDRIDEESRGRFGKLRDRALLSTLQSDFERCERAMPNPDFVVDTEALPADEAATRLVDFLKTQLP